MHTPIHRCVYTGRVLHPVRVRGHERHDCVTAGDALNLVDPEVGHVADWHDFCWRTPDDPPGYAAHSTDPEYRVVANVLGGRRTFDCRASLGALRLPAAERATPVWCAHHDRAILEAAWASWQASSFAAPWPLCPTVVDDWLWTPRQMQSLKRLAAEVEPSLPIEAQTGWRKWHDEQLRYGIER